MGSRLDNIKRGYGISSGSAPEPNRAPSLRHDLANLSPSRIAAQVYCEKKVDLEFRFPNVEITSAAIDSGSAGHNALEEGAEPVSRDELQKLIAAKARIPLLGVSLEAEFCGIAIRGVIDFVELEGNRADLLLEFKFSRWRRFFPDYLIQLDAYGYLLGENGFDTDGLSLALVTLPRSTLTTGPRLKLALYEGAELAAIHSAAKKLNRHLKGRSARRRLVSMSLPRGSYTSALGLASLEGLSAQTDNFTAYLVPYSRERAEAGLAWAVDYWTARREAVPTDNPNKCRVCEYNACRLCPFALVEPDPRIQVHTSRSGGDTLYRVRIR